MIRLRTLGTVDVQDSDGADLRPMLADSAFVWLGRHRWTMAELSSLRASYFMDPIRGDPRYPRLLEDIGTAVKAPAEQPSGKR